MTRGLPGCAETKKRPKRMHRRRKDRDRDTIVAGKASAREEAEACGGKMGKAAAVLSIGGTLMFTWSVAMMTMSDPNDE